MDDMIRCLLCGLVQPNQPVAACVNCKCCGAYYLSDGAQSSFPMIEPGRPWVLIDQPTHSAKAKAAILIWQIRDHWERLKQPMVIEKQHLEDPERSFGVTLPTVPVKLERALTVIGNRSPRVGADVLVSITEDWPLFQATDPLEAFGLMTVLLQQGAVGRFVWDYGEQRFPIDNQIAGADVAWNSLEMIESTYSRNKQAISGAVRTKTLEQLNAIVLAPLKVRCKVTAEGWNRIDALRRERPDNPTLFGALWFDESMKLPWRDGIALAAKNCGYSPVRLDEVPHNDLIIDRIFAEVRKATLVVADLTEHRNGVYLEGGLAMGLGKPVIWTCRKDQVDQAHTDVKPYNMLVWKDPKDLCEALTARIQGQYPLKR